jgi:hypothetical protein
VENVVVISRMLPEICSSFPLLLTRERLLGQFLKSKGEMAFVAGPEERDAAAISSAPGPDLNNHLWECM